MFLTLTVLSPFIPAFSDGAIRFIGLIILLAWYFSTGRKQARFVKEHYGDTYPKKPWGKPLLIAFACFIGFMIACAAVAFAAALINHQSASRVELSRGEAC